MPITSDILKKFKKNVNIFVETGSYLGDGVTSAIQSGFNRIYSIEFYLKRYKHCCEKFKGVASVTMVQGDSSEKLKEVLMQVSEPALFWLDAHYDAGGVESDVPVPLADTFPLMKELEQIKHHHIKSHTILVDDRRIFTGNNIVWHNIKENDVICKLKEINLQYEISFVDSACFEKDIIVAEVV